MASDVILGLYTNYSSDFSLTSGYYSLVIGSPVKDCKNIPVGMIVKEIHAAKYAVFTAKAHLAQLEKLGQKFGKIQPSNEHLPTILSGMIQKVPMTQIL